MSLGNLLNEGCNAFQCALLDHNELPRLRLGQIRQSDIQKVHRDCGASIGREGPNLRFADSLREVGAQVSLFKAEPLALDAERQYVPVPVGHEPIYTHSPGFDLIYRQYMLAFTINYLVGL
jgi:hypothetical protein